LGIINVDFDATRQLLIISYSAFVKYVKKACNSIRRQVSYRILTEFGIPMKLVRLIKMCLTETYSRVRVRKKLSDMLPVRSGLKQGDALSPLLFNFALEYTIRRVPRWLEIKWYTSASGLCR